MLFRKTVEFCIGPAILFFRNKKKVLFYIICKSVENSRFYKSEIAADAIVRSSSYRKYCRHLHIMRKKKKRISTIISTIIFSLAPHDLMPHLSLYSIIIIIIIALIRYRLYNIITMQLLYMFCHRNIAERKYNSNSYGFLRK